MPSITVTNTSSNSNIVGKNTSSNSNLYSVGKPPVLWTVPDFNPTTPTSLVDKSLYGNDGTFTNVTMSQLSNKLWTARFNGSAYINIDNVLNQLANTTKGTLMTWVELDDATPASTNIVFAFGDTDGTTQTWFGFLAGGVMRGDMTISGALKWRLNTDAAPLSDGTYAHIALIQDGVSPIILVNKIGRAHV